MGNHQPVTLDQMKRMADKQAEPLIAKLKDDPKNADLLSQIGKIYFSTHQFKDAADYLNKALEIKPKDNPTRTLLASCLYYDGDVDGALTATRPSHRKRSQRCQCSVQPRHDSLAGEEGYKRRA